MGLNKELIVAQDLVAKAKERLIRVRDQLDAATQLLAWRQQRLDEIRAEIDGMKLICELLDDEDEEIHGESKKS